VTATLTIPRERLPTRRGSINFNFQCGTLIYVATISFFPDGRLAEICLRNGRAGSTADSIAKDSAVVCSLALQHGVPLEVIRLALLRNADGSPATALGAALDIISGRAR
jgi:ribonucleoside-diphosphate reductase alpha chain